jgi:fermentation-respiration switch protein FrsA (DUF1100 family)
MRHVIAGTVALVVTLLALYGAATFLRRTSMFFPERFPSGNWDRPANSEEVHFTAPDGTRLVGWHIRAARDAAPLIVWFHGNGGNITERAPIAEEFARRGFSVFLFDWRGYGKSEGVPTEEALYQDALGAYDVAAHDLHAQSIVFYGESLGGPYAAYVASRRNASAVVIENSFPSLKDLGNAMYFPLGWFAGRAMNTVGWLNKANVRVLVLHGKHDQVIPFALGQRLFDELRTPKAMFVSEDAGHCEIPSRDAARYYDAVTSFIAP